jgi:hypothetical protein
MTTTTAAAVDVVSTQSYTHVASNAVMDISSTAVSAAATDATATGWLDKIFTALLAKSPSPGMNVAKAVFLASTMFIIATAITVALNKKTRDRLWNELGGPLK